MFFSYCNNDNRINCMTCIKKKRKTFIEPCSWESVEKPVNMFGIQLLQLRRDQLDHDIIGNKSALVDVLEYRNNLAFRNAVFQNLNSMKSTCDVYAIFFYSTVKCSIFLNYFSLLKWYFFFAIPFGVWTIALMLDFDTGLLSDM